MDKPLTGELSYPVTDIVVNSNFPGSVLTRLDKLSK